jgi:YbbR domain-containing protein
VRFVPKYLGVRALAVVLAFLLWVHVVTNKEYEYSVAFPLKVVGVQDGLLLVSNLPPECEVKVRGSGKQLLRFLAEVESFSIDVSAYSTGLYVLDLTPADLIADFKSETEIAEVIRPEKLRLQFEERLEKMVRVVPDLEITPALGYLKENELTVTPDSVLVIGPRQLVRKMETIRTEHLNYTDVSSPLREEVRLTLPDSAHLTLSDSSVMIAQDIVQLKERTISNIPLSVRNANSNWQYAIVPDTISVTVEASPALLDSISADQIEASIDIAAALPGSTFVSPRVTFPKGLRLVNVKPNEILVEVPRE